MSDLENIEKSIRKIELSILKAKRENLSWEETQEVLERNYDLAIKEDLLNKLYELYEKIPKRYRKNFEKKLQRGIVQISSDFFTSVPKLIYEKKDWAIERLFKDLVGQIVFCFCARALLIYAKSEWVWQKDFQRLVNRYEAYSFRKRKTIPLALPWGKRTADKLGFHLLIDWKRLSKGWRIYLLHREELRSWKYIEEHYNSKKQITKVLVKVPSFSDIHRSRMVTIENLDREPEEWNWSCECKDFIVQQHRKILVMCQHVAAVIYKLMDEGKIKKPWDKR